MYDDISIPPTILPFYPPSKSRKSPRGKNSLAGHDFQMVESSSRFMKKVASRLQTNASALAKSKTGKLKKDHTFEMIGNKPSLNKKTKGK